MDEKTIAILKRYRSTNPRFDEIYEVHVNRESGHKDVIATTGQIFLDVRRADYAHAFTPIFRIPAEWFWCFTQIENNEDVDTADQSMIDRIPKNVLKQLQKDADLAPVTFLKIKQINYCEHIRGKVKRRIKPAPDNVVFFKWSLGLGVCVCDH